MHLSPLFRVYAVAFTLSVELTDETIKAVAASKRAARIGNLLQNIETTIEFFG